MPENTIPSFIKALEFGVHTLELDIAVSAENELIVSHEPYFSSDICLNPDGNEYSDNRALEYNIFRMTYDEIAAFDCGSKFHPRFPQQEKIKVSKPRLADAVDAVNAYCDTHNLPHPLWNIEIKSRPEWDNLYHPAPDEYAKLVFEFLKSRKLEGKSIVQSFDVRTLQAYYKLDAGFQSALLVDNNLSPQANLDKLGFTPAIYSPNYLLVTPDLVKWCHEKGMKIYPWTVNEIPAMRKMIDYGVDGLITDYPDRYRDLTTI